MLHELVSDNAGVFLKALEYLSKKYHINHIRISGYNSRANGLVECAHFDVWQSLFKACSGMRTKWFQVLFAVFWAECIMIHRRLGVSPYYIVMGTHPLIPMDVVEAMYLLPPPESVLSTTDLIVCRAIALQKRQEDLERIHGRVYDVRRTAACTSRRFTSEPFTTSTSSVVTSCLSATPRSRRA